MIDRHQRSLPQALEHMQVFRQGRSEQGDSCLSRQFDIQRFCPGAFTQSGKEQDLDLIDEKLASNLTHAAPGCGGHENVQIVLLGLTGNRLHEEFLQWAAAAQCRTQPYFTGDDQAGAQFAICR